MFVVFYEAILATSKYLGLLNFLNTAFNDDETIDLDKFSKTLLQDFNYSSLNPVCFSSLLISDKDPGDPFFNNFL